MIPLKRSWNLIPSEGYLKYTWSLLPEEIRNVLDYVGADEEWYKKIKSGDNTAFATIADVLTAYADQW